MPDSRYPIVAIGCSTGAAETLRAFFGAFTEEPGFAMIVIPPVETHGWEDLCKELSTGSPVKFAMAEDGVRVLAGHAYLIPHHCAATFRDGALHLSVPQPGEHAPRPIDNFFASLAEDRREYAVGVLLAGEDGDGTLGSKAIREVGGLTLARVTKAEPMDTAAMPESAVSSDVVDLEMQPEAMPHRLEVFARSFRALSDARSAGDAHRAAELDRIHHEICALLTAHSSHDFSGYKTRSFFRRVYRRLQVRQLQTLDAYLELLRKDPVEIGNLFRDLLINVTNFFRDAEAFAQLERQIVPLLFEGKSRGDTLRIWVPGCSTGEEVYSLAILLREHMDRIETPPQVQIFATDIDEAALSVARTGRYPDSLLAEVSPERVKRFFKPDGDSRVVTAEIRELCIFSPHSLVRDPPFSRMDMVSCRNLLIYFGPDVQRHVIPTFHYSLRPGGYLFLGSSESIGPHGDLFATIDKKHRIYQAREHVGRSLKVPALTGPSRARNFSEGTASMPKERMGSLRSRIESRILERYAPAHVAVTSDADIVYYSAGTGRVLEAPQGAPSRHLLTLARHGLRLDLRGALRECVRTQTRVTRQGLRIESEGEPIQLVDISIEPLGDSKGADLLYLVVFDLRGSPDAEAIPQTGDDEARRHGEYEQELRDTKERLQSTIEEYETALEELKSSNEELTSVNEEMQSANEELEASKEESQSLNEELNTINAELNHKIDELDRANSDLQNLFESTGIATIFLDEALVIRSFTPAAAAFFNLRNSDIGRPLTDLSGAQEYPDLHAEIDRVFRLGEPDQRQLGADADGRHYLLRLNPYRTGSAAIDGVVVTFVDVTQLAEAEQHQQVLVDELNHRVKNLLLVVTAISRRTLERSPDLETFGQAFTGRLEALNRTYGTLSRESWKNASLAGILADELRPHGEQAFSLEGEDLNLSPQMGLSLAMAVHELATNAMKYGALSAEGGTVTVSWSVDAGRLRIRWRETGGPPVTPPEDKGFGSELLHGEIEYRLQGTLTLAFPPEGLDVQIEVPLGT
ncbi:chemotaxis protein CheR [Pararhodobacter marinus]|uniref:histidine kinase n=1 Tax=Pararhodobacter marinus TaxID=2184063 RepID=A0A2U2CIR6_9RHOB|nr:CheR family methyltransferase [Pararhodobacter marinus]PWE31719.1 chemotaxis protein CheR [Pararhodobacter marinus]